MKVLVVDDSALMRKYLCRILEADPSIEVETARDGQDCLDKIPKFDPDVVTLDINMPVMDGLTCLAHIMAEMPRPVLMVSSLTEKGALATFEAMELGAVDYVSKPGGTVSLNIMEVEKEILAKVKAAYHSRCRKARPTRRKLGAGVRAPKMRRPATRVPAGGDGVVVIGVSTGGPRAVEDILAALPGDFPLPVLVAQHMPARFTEVFARRLNQNCELSVSEVRRATPIEPGTAYIARGDADMRLSRRGGRPVAVSVPASREYLWHPSVDYLVKSVMEVYEPEGVIGVLLTGMGYDGAEAIAELHAKGGRTIAESEESAVVFGMPKELIERKGADLVLPVEKVAGQLVRWTN